MLLRHLDDGRPGRADDSRATGRELNGNGRYSSQPGISTNPGTDGQPNSGTTDRQAHPDSRNTRYFSNRRA